MSVILSPQSKCSSAVGASRQYMHGQTYQAHPMVCAAALEVQHIIQEQDLVTKAREMGTVLETKLKVAFAAHPQVGNIRGRGLFWAVSSDETPSVYFNYCVAHWLIFTRTKLEFVKDRESKESFDPALAVAMTIHNEGILQTPGIMLYPGTGSADGRKGDHIIIAPPYTITAEEVEMVVAVAQKAVDSPLKRLLQSNVTRTPS